MNWDFQLLRAKSILISSLNKSNFIQVCVLVFPPPSDTIIELYSGFLFGLCLNLLWYFTGWPWFRIWVVFLLIHYMILIYFSRCSSDIFLILLWCFTQFQAAGFHSSYCNSAANILFLYSQSVIFSFLFIFRIFILI